MAPGLAGLGQLAGGACIGLYEAERVVGASAEIVRQGRTQALQVGALAARFFERLPQILVKRVGGRKSDDERVCQNNLDPAGVASIDRINEIADVLGVVQRHMLDPVGQREDHDVLMKGFVVGELLHLKIIQPACGRGGEWGGRHAHAAALSAYSAWQAASSALMSLTPQWQSLPLLAPVSRRAKVELIVMGPTSRPASWARKNS